MMKLNKGFVTLVIGLPGSGKTYYVKQNLGNGVVFDLDHIAAALRLQDPHSGRHEAARMISNDLLIDFMAKARRHSKNIYVIRTAPSIFEVSQIKPDKIIVCKGSYNITKRPDYMPVNRYEYLGKIQTVINYAKAESISLEELSEKL